MVEEYLIIGVEEINVGRHDLYEELGADVKKYGELIEKELEDTVKLPFGV